MIKNMENYIVDRIYSDLHKMVDNGYNYYHICQRIEYLHDYTFVKIPEIKRQLLLLLSYMIAEGHRINEGSKKLWN